MNRAPVIAVAGGHCGLGSERSFGRLDVLIKNAGIIAEEEAPALRIKLAAVRATPEINTLAPLQLTQVLIPLLRRSAASASFNIEWDGALSDMDGDRAAYQVSKAALNTRTLINWRPNSGDAVAVSSVCSGWLRTDMDGPHAERDIAKGTATVVWLALDAPKRNSCAIAVGSESARRSCARCFRYCGQYGAAP